MTNDLPSWLTQDWLAGATLEQRHQIWWNARDRGGVQGELVASFIETSGLSYTPRGYLGEADPRVILLTEIVNSPEGQRLCEEATAVGKPALAGVDGLIAVALGPDYCRENGTTQTAGDRVAKMMRSIGYVDTTKKNMPTGSVAKNAQAFKRKT